MKFVRPINDSTPSISNPFSASHTGIDYAYPEGTLVYAAASGQVTIAKGDETRQWLANQPGDPFKPARGARALRTEDYGNFVKIVHAEGYSTLYAHLKYGSLLVAAGTQVRAGQPIAAIGSTGNSTGNHTHWEVRLQEKTVAPGPLTDTSFTGYLQPDPTITIPSRTFEELVTKATRYDGFTAAGYLTPEDVQQKVGDVERDKAGLSKELESAHGTNKNLADEIRAMEEQREETARQLLDVSHQRDELTTRLVAVCDQLGLAPNATQRQIFTAITKLKEAGAHPVDREMTFGEWLAYGGRYIPLIHS